MPARRLWMKSGASGRAVDLDHTSVQNDGDQNGHDLHTEAAKHSFYAETN